MQFARTIGQSIYGPDFYRSLFAQPLSFSLKYFFSLVLVLAVVHTATLSYTFIPLLNSFLKNLDSKILAYYPDSLEITIEKGEASSNAEEPYFLPWPEELTFPEAGMDAPKSSFVT